MKTIKVTEDKMQQALIAWAKLHPVCSKYLFHIPNGGKKEIKVNVDRYGRVNKYCPSGVKLAAMGVKPGIPDLLLAYPCNGFHGLFIELKVGKNKNRPDQESVQHDLTIVDYAVAVVYDDWTKAKEQIERYLGG